MFFKLFLYPLILMLEFWDSLIFGAKSLFFYFFIFGEIGVKSLGMTMMEVFEYSS